LIAQLSERDSYQSEKHSHQYRSDVELENYTGPQIVDDARLEEI